MTEGVNVLIDDISLLLCAENTADQRKGIAKVIEENSFFHILQVQKLASSPERETAERAFKASIALAKRCIEPAAQENLPEAVVYAAVKILKNLEPEYEDELIEEMGAGNPQNLVRILAVLKFFLSRKKAEMYFNKFLLCPERDVRIAAIVHLGGVSSRITGYHLEEYLKNSDNRVKANVIELLETLKATSYIHVLSGFRISENNRVRANALKALHRLGEKRIGDDLRFMLLDPNTLMRASAVWALGEIGAQASELLPLLAIVSQDKAAIVRKNLQLAAEKLGAVPGLEQVLSGLAQAGTI